MAVCTLGSMKWRIDPNGVSWQYQIDANTIPTLGGQVVQILGATTGDLTLQGDFGQDRANNVDSWELAVAFHKRIQQMMDAQTLPAKTVTAQKAFTTAGTSDAAVVHSPLAFTYMDGIHNWNMQVLIKGITDADGSASLSHSTGKFSYGYAITLFIVDSGTTDLKKLSTDAYIENVSKGLGWAPTGYSGSTSVAATQAFLAGHGGSLEGYENTILGGTS